MNAFGSNGNMKVPLNIFGFCDGRPGFTHYGLLIQLAQVGNSFGDLPG
jgi:hypothetical protein